MQKDATFGGKRFEVGEARRRGGVDRGHVHLRIAVGDDVAQADRAPHRLRRRRGDHAVLREAGKRLGEVLRCGPSEPLPRDPVQPGVADLDTAVAHGDQRCTFPEPRALSARGSISAAGYSPGDGDRRT